MGLLQDNQHIVPLLDAYTCPYGVVLVMPRASQSVFTWARSRGEAARHAEMVTIMQQWACGMVLLRGEGGTEREEARPPKLGGGMAPKNGRRHDRKAQIVRLWGHDNVMTFRHEFKKREEA